MMGNVTVTNKNSEAYSRKFDGTLYEFAPGKPITVSEEAASYLFAYGKEDGERKRILVRNGWHRNSTLDDDFGPIKAMGRLDNFIFKKAPDDPGQAKPEKKIAPLQRALTGINAVNPDAKDDGRTILPRDITNRKAPLAQPARGA